MSHARSKRVPRVNRVNRDRENGKRKQKRFTGSFLVSRVEILSRVQCDNPWRTSKRSPRITGDFRYNKGDKREPRMIYGENLRQLRSSSLRSNSKRVPGIYPTYFLRHLAFAHPSNIFSSAFRNFPRSLDSKYVTIRA